MLLCVCAGVEYACVIMCMWKGAYAYITPCSNNSQSVINVVWLALNRTAWSMVISKVMPNMFLVQWTPPSMDSIHFGPLPAMEVFSVSCVYMVNSAP